MIINSDYIKYIEENIHDKRHIVITGVIGSGKTTLLNALRDTLDSGDSVPGLVTWNDQGKAVYMRKTGDSESVTIGECVSDSLIGSIRMQPVPDSFKTYGISSIEEFINSDSDWVTVDEIGFLEGSCTAYIKKLQELFDKKRVMAVVRKQDIEHINAILQRKDVFVIDLDII